MNYCGQVGLLSSQSQPRRLSLRHWDPTACHFLYSFGSDGLSFGPSDLMAGHLYRTSSRSVFYRAARTKQFVYLRSHIISASPGIVCDNMKTQFAKLFFVKIEQNGTILPRILYVGLIQSCRHINIRRIAVKNPPPY